MPRQTPRSTLPGVGVVLLLISLFGCRSRNTPSSAPSASSSARPSPSFGTSPPPSASASARVSPTFVALQTQLTRAPAWPTGPGVVCGEARCQAGEICCDGARCTPKSREKACLDARGTALGCDESSDCAEGQICCYGIIYEKEARKVSCQKPSVCEIPLSRPGSLPFPGRELCARGGSCRDPRLVCIDDEGMPSGGRCVSRIGEVSCGEGLRCTGARPWCLWDPGTRTGECIPRGPWEHEDGVNSCDGPEDCVGEPCSTHESRSFCSMDSTEPFRFAAGTCHRDADCPGTEVISKTRRTTWKCAPVEGVAVPGMRECDASDEISP